MKLKNYNKLFAEFFGTALLLAVVTGSGIMGVNLSNGNDAITLLANSIATGCGLFVLITLLAPISSAHFNPVVSFVAWYNKTLSTENLYKYIIAQLSGAVFGVWLTHIFFNLPIIQFSTKTRDSLALWVSELVATLILLSVINIGMKYAKEQIALLVALTVTAGYWFTSSTFFCNPAVTLARSLTNTFVGISASSLFCFISAQLLAVLIFIFISNSFSKAS